MKYKELIKDQIQHFTILEDAKTVAVLVGAIHMYGTLTQISESKLTRWHPATANVCIHDIEDIAINLSKEKQSEQPEITA